MSPLNHTQIAAARAQFRTTRALIIVGPQGSGKTLLANLLASNYQFRAACSPEEFMDRNGHVFSQGPEVIIVDGVEARRHLIVSGSRFAQAIKAVLTTDTVQTRRPYGLIESVSAPKKIILCVDGSADLNPEALSRRFKVFRMDAAAK